MAQAVKIRRTMTWAIKEFLNSDLVKVAAVRQWYYDLIPHYRGTGGSTVVHEVSSQSGEVQFTHPGGGVYIQRYTSSEGEQSPNVLFRLEPNIYMFDSRDNTTAMALTTDNVFTNPIRVYIPDLISVAQENMGGDLIMSAPSTGSNWYPITPPTAIGMEAVLGIKSFGYDDTDAYIDVYVHQLSGSAVLAIDWIFGASTWVERPA